jgi:4-hydroxybenzoate polyprenyltransferase
VSTASIANNQPAATLSARLRLAAGDIKLSHSIFAMPFALLGAFLARTPDAPWPRFAWQLLLVVACMVLARSWAMLINRLADARLDADNPRTKGRAIASGKLTARDGRVLAGACALGFVGLCSIFWFAFANFWPVALSVPVLAWLAFYSFAKRFTLLCHVLLGTALACSPIAAAIAIDPHALTRTPALYWLAGMVTLWVAGFDIIYALQDADHDARVGLHSIPSKLGKGRAVWISRAMHALALACLIMAGMSDARLGPIWFGACAIVALLLIGEHLVLIRRGLAGLPMAFFTLNGVVSCVVGTLGIIDTLV